MNLEDASRVIAHLNALKILFLGEAGKVGLLKEVDFLISKLDQASNRLDASSNSFNEDTKQKLTELVASIANEVTVSALEYEYSKIYTLVSESLDGLSDDAAKKVIAALLSRAKGQNKQRVASSDVIETLQRENVKYKYLFFGSFVSFTLVLIFLFAYSLAS